MILLFYITGTFVVNNTTGFVTIQITSRKKQVRKYQIVCICFGLGDCQYVIKRR